MDEITKLLAQLSNPILTACAIYIAHKLGELSKSIDELNTKIAVIVERVDTHEKRITKLEE